MLQHHSSTYDHRHWKTRDPVRSPLDKPATARLVVGWVTTSESLVLYVFALFEAFLALKAVSSECFPLMFISSFCTRHIFIRIFVFGDGGLVRQPQLARGLVAPRDPGPVDLPGKGLKFQLAWGHVEASSQPIQDIATSLYILLLHTPFIDRAEERETNCEQSACTLLPRLEDLAWDSKTIGTRPGNFVLANPPFVSPRKVGLGAIGYSPSSVAVKEHSFIAHLLLAKEKEPASISQPICRREKNG